ncbi:hypothetical protein D3C71_1398980 [compost metagenome]
MRHPEVQAIGRGFDHVVDERHDRHFTGQQHPPDRAEHRLFGTFVLGQVFRQQVLLVAAQPFRGFNVAVQLPQHQQAQHHTRQAGHQEQPVPAGQAQHAVHRPQQETRRRATHRASQRYGQEPQAIHLRQVLSGEPARQVEQDGRPEPSFHHADQKPQEVQRVLGVGKHQRGGRQPPRDHDPANPRRRAVAFEPKAAGHLEQHIADEEHARGQAIGRIAQAQLLLHLGLGEADVDPIEVGKQKADDGQRHDAPGHAAVQQQLIDVTVVALTRQFTGHGNHGGSPFL